MNLKHQKTYVHCLNWCKSNISKLNKHKILLNKWISKEKEMSIWAQVKISYHIQQEESSFSHQFPFTSLLPTCVPIPCFMF